MDMPTLADPQELIYISFVWTQNILWKTYREQWTIGMDGDGEPEKSVQSAPHGDDDIMSKFDPH